MDTKGRCLVTGVAGFIGSHLAERLIREGYEVVGIDRFSDYYPRRLKEQNLLGLQVQRGFQLFEADLATADLSPLLANVRFVYHEAAQAGVRASWGESFHIYLRDNALATQRLLEACKGRSVERLIYASSSSIYGDAADLPVTEETPAKPVSPYGVTKLAGEHLCYLYRTTYNVPAVALRYFTVYGPRQRPDMAFHRFIEAMRAGTPITVYGDGEQTRDFTFVGDAVEANLCALSRDTQEWRVWNIGGGSRASVNQVIASLGRIMGRQAKVRHMPAQHGDVRHTWADASTARRDLGFAPRTHLEEGLRAQVAWQMQATGKQSSDG